MSLAKVLCFGMAFKFCHQCGQHWYVFKNLFLILELGGERVHEQTDRPFTVVASHQTQLPGNGHSWHSGDGSGLFWCQDFDRAKV